MPLWIKVEGVGHNRCVTAIKMWSQPIRHWPWRRRFWPKERSLQFNTFDRIVSTAHFSIIKSEAGVTPRPRGSGGADPLF